MVPAVKAINSLRGSIASCLPALKEIERFFQESREATVVSGRELFRGFKDRIEFRNVHFRYRSDILSVLDGVSFVIKKGMRVGIVGASGSGKSTLVEVLLRFYDPQDGAIKVDNRELKDFDVVSWRKSIGFVPQDIFLFHDTVAANIAFPDPVASQEAIERAAARAYAHEFILSLPLGYNTRVGDRGVLLSAGQRQRVAIARAILNEPEILIFDEATSALDTESEQIIQQAIEEISKGKTVISIAHRLSTVASSDMIIVIDKGKIIESGTPKELLSRDGIYKKFFDLQSMN
jgi:subfamily B ATP-binding cassette protein MsbA